MFALSNLEHKENRANAILHLRGFRSFFHVVDNYRFFFVKLPYKSLIKFTQYAILFMRNKLNR